MLASRMTMVFCLSLTAAASPLAFAAPPKARATAPEATLKPGQRLLVTVKRSEKYRDFVFNLDGGKTVEVTATAKGAVRIELGVGTAAAFSALQSDFGFGESTIWFTADEQATYTLRVIGRDDSDDDTAAQVLLRERPTPKAVQVTPLALGKDQVQVKGVLADDGARLRSGHQLFEEWTLQLEQGQAVLVTAEAALDTALIIGQRGGQGRPGLFAQESDDLVTLQHDMDSGGDNNPRAAFVAPKRGEFVIRLYAENAAAKGSFALAVQPLPAPAAMPSAAVLAKGQPAFGSLAIGSASVLTRDDFPNAERQAYHVYQLFELRGVAGQQVVLQLSPVHSMWSPQLELGGSVDGRFAVVASGAAEDADEMRVGASRLAYTFGQTGNLLVRVRGNVGGQLGAFVLTAQ